ncbi:MAG: ECF transporter S component [Ruminococcaceae bacterium]|nr:ECF transporter S component [Oscillospiraceae bacterium]
MLTVSAPLRKMLRVILPLAIIPMTVGLGLFFLNERYYLPLSCVVALLALLLFYLGLDNQKLGTRRLVMVSVMTVLCIVGRWIPFFKPITALTVITALYLGPESGFLVGSLAALLSNISFGQGPWTPFQMLGWGLIGLIAGYLERPLRRHRVLLLLYGVAAGIFFSLLMDIFTALWYHSSFTIAAYLAVMATALPHTLLYACSNFIFLWYMAKPIGDKLNRLKLKYGI